MRFRPPPRSDAEWARDTENRVRRLESGARSVRIGQWVLTDRNGELVAVALDGRVVILSSPEATVVNAGDTVLTGTAFTRVVTVTLTGWVTGGTFTLTFNGLTTDPIPYDASAVVVKAALVGLPNYAEGDFVVTGSDGGPWTVAIPGVALTGDPSGLEWLLFEAGVQIS